MKVLLLTRYDRLGASSRLRMLQYVSALQSEGIECQIEPLVDDEYLRRLYRGARINVGYLMSRYVHRLKVLLLAREFDLAFIEKELFPNLPALFERVLIGANLPYAIDIDDAIFHNYNLAENPLKRLLKHKIGSVMRSARLVTAGNSYLAQYAADAGAKEIAVLPTAVDLHRYPLRDDLEKRDHLSIGWIGSPATVKLLGPLLPVLAKLVRHISFEFAVVGARIDDPSLPFVRNIAWREDTESEEIGHFDIGVMPLPDMPWERGKCSYKLIQYMACGKPVVASPVGMNVDVVQHGRNGYLASTTSEWYELLLCLLSDARLRRSLGLQGRNLVEDRYCVQVTAPKLAQLLKRAASRSEATLCVE